MGASLGWTEPERMRRFFEWKHDENPFGPSPAWVATAEGRVVGFRTFLRWELTDGERMIRAVRAVDTATHPEFQGRGIFRDLTMHGLDEMAAEGVELVFNTPNDQSRPGYLKMGWHVVGRVPIAIRPRNTAAVIRLARARVPAARWSVPATAGVDVGELLAHPGRAAHLVSARARGDVATAHRPDTLRWRYGGAGGVEYRALVADDRVDSCAVVVRARPRGSITEATIAEVLGPVDPSARRAIDAFLDASSADAAICHARHASRLRAVPVPRSGPVLTARRTDGAGPPEVDPSWFSLGDLELL